MEPIYVHSESTVKPSTLEIGKRTVFLRKNIVEEERTNELGNTTIFYIYEEAKMSHEDFNKYSNYIAAKNAINGVNDSKNISTLVAGQENRDNNQMIIMEAIADLYDAVASLSLGGTE